MREFGDQILAQYPFAQLKMPYGWLRLSLADIGCEVTPGFASGAHTSDGVGVAHLRPMNVDRDGKINLHVVKSVAATGGVELAAGDVLFNNTNSPELIGKTAVVSMREAGFAYSNHMTRICPPQGAASAYLAHQLHFLWMTGYMKHRCTNHVNQASISSKTLAETVPLLLPPCAEQTRIVDKLEELLSDLDAGVAELKAAQKKLAQYRQSLLKAAVEGRLTEVWRAQHGEPEESGAQLLARILRERRARWEARQVAKFEAQGKTLPSGWQGKYEEPASVDAKALPELPQGWVWARAEQLCDFITKGTTPPKGLDSDSNKVVPFLRVTNLTSDGALNLDDKVFVSEHIHRGFLARSVVYPGDVLMNIVGPPLGQVSVVPPRFAEWNINQAIAIFRAVNGVSSRFMSLCLLSAPAQAWLAAKAKTTAGQTNLTLEVCRDLPIALPTVTEQHAIAQSIDSVFGGLLDQDAAIAAALRQSAAQRKNILQAAFSGQLVPQDPNDEPASVLLARIRAERAAREAARSEGARAARRRKETT